MGGGGSAPRPEPAPTQSAMATSLSAKDVAAETTKNKRKGGVNLDNTLLKSSALGGNSSESMSQTLG